MDTPSNRNRIETIPEEGKPRPEASANKCGNAGFIGLRMQRKCLPEMPTGQRAGGIGCRHLESGLGSLKREALMFFWLKSRRIPMSDEDKVEIRGTADERAQFIAEAPAPLRPFLRVYEGTWLHRAMERIIIAWEEHEDWKTERKMEKLRRTLGR